MADGRPVGVEIEVRGKVIDGRVVEGELAGLDICITWAATTDFVTLAMAS